MNTQAMLETHPRDITIDTNVLNECVQACFECAFTCNACADACLGENQVAELVQCIRLNIDCADICATTGRMVSRMTQPPMRSLQAQLQACVQICKACGDECASHAEHHEHCAVCAEACRRCEQACQQMLNALPISQMQPQHS